MAELRALIAKYTSSEHNAHAIPRLFQEQRPGLGPQEPARGRSREAVRRVSRGRSRARS